MESILVFTFWATISFIVYTWLFYMLGLYLLSKIVKVFKTSNYFMVETPNHLTPQLPFVSVIVAAYNEEKVIARRIENLLEQDYPKERIEIIVASDGSTDRTVEIAKKYESQGVIVLDFKTNRGKASVHNDSVDVAKGDVLLFTDAETVFEKDFIINGIKWLANSKYGCGAGELEFYYKDEIGKSESMYWKIEKKMRYWEFLVEILPFASGGCFFIRKELYERIPPYSDIDNVLTLKTIAKGYKIFYAKDAKASDVAVNSSASFYKKRVRTTLRSFGDMVRCLPELFKKRKFTILWVLFSHRILRWLTGFFMGVVFLVNLLLVNKGLLYVTLFICQLVFYFFVLLGWYGEYKDRKSLIYKCGKIAFSFLLANLASSIGIIQLLRGSRILVWKND